MFPSQQSYTRGSQILFDQVASNHSSHRGRQSSIKEHLSYQPIEPTVNSITAENNRRIIKNIFDMDSESSFFTHPVKKHVPPAPIVEKPERWLSKKPVELDTSRAGTLSNPPRPQFTKKMVKQVPLQEPRPQARGRPSSELFQDAAGASSFHMNSRPSSRKLNENIGNVPPPPEEYKSKEQKRHLPSPRNDGSVKRQPIPGGGFIPENAKTSIKCQTIIKPQDHGDVLTYSYAKDTTVTRKPQIPNQEKRQYEQMMKESAFTQHQENSNVYNYLKARRCTTDPTLTEFLYDKRN